MPESKQRAVIYRRVSTADQIEGTSLDVQREECLAEIRARDLDLADEWDFSDGGRSGKDLDRPGLIRLREAATQAKFEIVVVAKADRLSRDHLDLLTLIKWFQALGLQVLTPEGDLIGATPEQRLSRNVLGAIAEFERELIRGRTRSGLRQTARTGGWPGGRAPFGFRLARESRTAHTYLEIEEEEAAVLRRAVDLLVDERRSTAQAANELNALGLRPRSAPRWTYVNLRKAMRTAPLSGTWRYRMGPSDGYPDGETIPMAIPALISSERHRALREVLEKRSQTRKADRRGKPYILGRGLMTSPCGVTFHGKAQEGRPAVYQCANVGPVADGRCRCYRIGADEIEHFVWNEVAKVLSNPATLDGIAREHLRNLEDAATVDAGEVAHLRSQVTAKEHALSNTAVAYLEEGVAPSVVKAATDRIQADLHLLRRRLDHAERLQDDQAVFAARLRSVQHLSAALSERLPTLADNDRRDVLDLLNVTVSVMGWEMCAGCSGRKVIPTGHGAERCEACSGIGHVPIVLIEGTLTEHLLMAPIAAPSPRENLEPSLVAPSRTARSPT